MRFNDIKPQFTIVIGGAGSGKNYFIEHDPVLSHFTLIDIDAIKGELGVGAAITAIKPMLIKSFEQKRNVAHPTTGTNLVAQQNKIELAKKYGYNVSVVLVDTPVDKAIEQVRERYRSGGHDVSLEKIVSSNKIARDNFNKLAPLASDSKVVNGSTVDEAAIPFAAPDKQQQYEKIWQAEINDFNRDGDETNIFDNPNNHNLELLGKGGEAVVFKDKNDESVLKVQGNENELKNDPYLQYILLSKKYMNVNPYFPKVQSIQQIQVTYRYRRMFVIQLEHLVHIDKVPRADIIKMFKQIFSMDDTRLPPTYQSLAEAVYHSIKNPDRSGNPTVIDSNFRNVGNLIRLVIKRTGGKAFVDLHYNNMMVRYANGEPQLVITDPVAV